MTYQDLIVLTLNPLAWPCETCRVQNMCDTCYAALTPDAKDAYNALAKAIGAFPSLLDRSEALSLPDYDAKVASHVAAYQDYLNRR